MAENSKIEWTDATVNFWWGCTKVSPGCDHCYAERWDGRFGGTHWGQGAPRRKIKSAVKTLHRLNNGLRRRAFIQSMSDLFDNEVPLEWFAEAWETITVCDRLDLQILTKRISMVEKRLAAIGAKGWPQHAGLMITTVNQDEADRDIPRVLDLKARLGVPWVGISVEPMLGPVDFEGMWEPHPNPGHHVNMLERLDWIICGGESGPGARVPDDFEDSARLLRDQCAELGVAYFFKQMPKKAPIPADLMVRQFPTQAAE